MTCTIQLDTVDPTDQDFKAWLADLGIKAVIRRRLKNGYYDVKYSGSKAALQELCKEVFCDEGLAEYIEEVQR